MGDDRRPRTSKQRRHLHRAREAAPLPVLLVRGRMSDVVSEETAQEFLELVPHAQYVDVRDAHHMVAGDRNDAFTAAGRRLPARSI